MQVKYKNQSLQMQQRWGLGVNGAGQVVEGHSNITICLFTDGF